MISYSEAVEIICEASSQQQEEARPVIEAVGYVAARNVVSAIANPPFRNSAMDGFALHSAATAAASQAEPLALRVTGCNAAGDLSGGDHVVGENEALEIMTGAVVPSSLDAVCRVEDVIQEQDDQGGVIKISQPLQPGANIREAGEDYGVGETLLSAGELVTPGHAMLLAANGVCEVPVRQKPKIALLSTGKEVIDFSTPKGSSLEKGQIYNSTAPFLITALKQLGAEPTYYGTIPDEPEVFFPTLEKILSDEPDAIITTGAVSMGKADFIPAALRDAGGEVLFHKAKVRPGKPVLFGRLPEKSRPVLFFGLPGNPLSVVVGVRFFVLPYMQASTGSAAEQSFTAVSAADYRKPEHLRCFCPCKMRTSDGQMEVFLDQQQRSFMLKPAAGSHVWAILPEGKDTVSKGEKVQCVSFFPHR